MCWIIQLQKRVIILGYLLGKTFYVIWENRLVRFEFSVCYLRHHANLENKQEYEITIGPIYLPMRSLDMLFVLTMLREMNERYAIQINQFSWLQ